MSRATRMSLIGVLAAGAILCSLWFGPRAHAEKVKAVGEHVDWLPVVQLAGSRVDIAANKGWKIVYFWSDSCPCVKRCEQVNFIPLSRRFQGQVSFYGIASNASNVRYRKIQEHGNEVELPLLRVPGSAGFWPPYPLLVDARHQVADLLGATFTPEVFLLSPDNELLYRGVPDDSKEYEERTGKRGLTQNYLQEALEEALAGKKVTRPTMPARAFCAIDRTDVASK